MKLLPTLQVVGLLCLLIEVIVSAQQGCSPGDLVCPSVENGSRCIDYSQLCDGVNDCPVPVGGGLSADEGGVDSIACKF